MSSIYTSPKAVLLPPSRPVRHRAPAEDSHDGGTDSLGLECRVRALRMLAVTLLKQLESMECESAEPSELHVESLVDEFEAQLIQSALTLTRGHQRRAAEILRLKANTLNNKMRRHELASHPVS